MRIYPNIWTFYCRNKISAKLLPKNLHQNDKNRLMYLSEMHLRCAYVFELMKSFFGPDIQKRLEMVIRDDARRKRTPVEIVFNTDIYNPELLAKMSDVERIETTKLYVVINHQSLAWIVDNIFKPKDGEVGSRDKYLQDWCEDLESSVIQEISHIAYLSSAENNKDMARILSKYPKDFDDSLTNEDRDNLYLSTDIEYYGRLWEQVFLKKYYPNSWSEAWLLHDLEKSESVRRKLLVGTRC